MILTDELCDTLCKAAREKSKQLGIDISFAVCDEHGLPGSIAASERRWCSA